MPVDDPSSASPQPLSDPLPHPHAQPTGRRVVVAASWRDHSITAIAAEAARRGELDARYVVDDRFVAGLALLKGGFRASARAHAARARERSARQSAAGDVRVGRRPELMRVVGAVTDPRTGWELGERRWKTAYDHAVARRLARRPLGPGDVVVGMPGSSLRTFATVPAGVVRVFNAIDAHPREHNRVLEEAYGRAAARAEIYPEALVERIEAELALADHVLVPSRATADGMTRHGVPAEKVRVHPYAVSLADFGLTDGEDAPARPDARPRVLFVGQVCHRKGIPSLLEAARRVPGVDVRLAGPVFHAHLLADLPSNVTVLGTLDPVALRAEYRAADAFVLPTLDDTFGFVVTEAAAAGLPLILSPHCGAREVVAALPATTTVDPLGADGTGDLAAALHAVVALDWDTRLAHARAFRGLDRPHPDWAHYGAAVLDSVTTGAVR